MAATRMEAAKRCAASAVGVATLCAGAVFFSPVAFASLYGSGLYGAGAYGGTTSVPPQQALNPSPADGATSVSTSTSLSWTAGSGATAHAVYFGTDSTPDDTEYQGSQAGTTYDPGTLAYSTTYYWRVDEVNGTGTTTGTVWSFTTAAAPSVGGGGGGSSSGKPSKASTPYPANNATNVSTVPTLTWKGDSTTLRYGIFFGTTKSLPATSYKATKTTSSYAPGTLSPNTTYYWRIDSANDKGTTTGTAWSFKTGTISTATTGGGALARTDTTNWIHTVSPENVSAMSKAGAYRKPFFTYAGLTGMLIKVHEAEGTIYIVAGAGSKLQQVYPAAKVLRNGVWQPIKLTGIWPMQANGW